MYLVYFSLPDGSTCVSALVTPDRILVANIGDSRAILCYEPFLYAEKQDALGPTEKCKVLELSIDDKPDRPDEAKRIEALGGFIQFIGCWRVQGILATSRSFGDKDLKRFVIAEPTFQEVFFADPQQSAALPSDGASRLKGRPLFLVLASDGLWDVMSNQQVAHFIFDRRAVPDYGVKELLDHALRCGSADNITAVVVDLHRPRLSGVL